MGRRAARDNRVSTFGRNTRVCVYIKREGENPPPSRDSSDRITPTKNTSNRRGFRDSNVNV